MLDFSAFAFVLLSFILSHLSSASSSDSSSDEPEGDYLYENDFPPVIDFMRTEFNDGEGKVDSAVMAYLAGADKKGTAERNAKFEEEMRHPDFLFAEDNGNRVVEFYAPWCPHCQEYKSHYVDLAKEVRSKKGASEIKFHAVSCTAHKPICQDFDIHSYPRVLSLKAGSIEGDVYKKSQVSAELILNTFGIEVISDEGEANIEKVKKGSAKTVSTGNRGRIPREKEDIYRDATLSFDFALRNAIYTGSGPLAKDSKRALENWLDVMRKTMPMEMSLIHKQIDALLLNLPQVIINEDNLNEAIKDLQPERKTWSKSCTHGKKIGGYTCGLWEMFHIMTIGITEWNIVSPHSLRVSTNHAAESLRGYIEHFFGCEVCQANFIWAYDACSRDRCDRLSDKTDGATLSDWKQLPLWLWETHNDVNVRLLKEKAVREDKPTPTEEEQQAVRWPFKEDCQRCWNDDWSWNEEVVFSFLRLEYWPDDDKAEQHRNIKQFGPEPEPVHFNWEDHIEEPADSSRLMYGAPVGTVSLIGLWWFYQKRERDRTGHHKKFDASQHDYPRNGTTPSGQDTYFSHRV